MIIGDFISSIDITLQK